jgi:hypothetical protein
MASSSSSHLPHAVIAGRNPASGASWQKGENTMGSSSVVAHVSGEEQRGGLVDLAHVNSVRDIFVLNAADIGDARSEAEAVEEEEEERELISDTFRSTALVSSREQVNGKPFCFSFPSAFVVSNPFLIFWCFCSRFVLPKLELEFVVGRIVGGNAGGGASGWREYMLLLRVHRMQPSIPSTRVETWFFLSLVLWKEEALFSQRNKLINSV